MLNAFHSNWTTPFFHRNKARQYFIEDYELLTTILSALIWRKHNGSIKMVTDTPGMEYYQKLGIAHIWDMGIDTSLDELEKESFSPLSLWAAGKIIALSRQPVPCVMLDTDFIVWKSIAGYTEGTVLAVAHREEITPLIYPEKSFFNMAKTYTFPPEWDWSQQPCNTALLYIADEEFKNYYTSESIRFMCNLQETKDIIAEMVFAEQRILAMCAAARDISVTTFLDVNNLETQDLFTHVWGFKMELQNKQKKRRDFCINCVKRIVSDFPHEIAALEKIDILKPYFEIMSNKQTRMF